VTPHARIEVLGLPAFPVCGGAGAAAGTALACALAVRTGRSVAAVVVMAAAAGITFLVVALATRVVLREERLTFYHHAVAITCVQSLVLVALRQPALADLDLAIVGLATGLAGGRIGCLLVGCCHGRPAAWGVVYAGADAEEGFPAHLVGVRLLPVQALESALAAALAAAGVLIVLAGAAPGTAVAACVSGYAVGRFFFEFLRGDAERPHLAGLSEAQWTSLLVAGVVPVAAVAGLLPRAAWEAAPAAAVALAIAVMARRRGAGVERLLRPAHVRELAEAAALASPARGRRTSEGVLVTAERVGPTQLYALSRTPVGLTPAAAGAIARLLLLLRHPHGDHELVTAGNGVYHLLVR
jgi:Prolipoprotein diacylglyceryl transferase